MYRLFRRSPSTNPPGRAYGRARGGSLCETCEFLSKAREESASIYGSRHTTPQQPTCRSTHARARSVRDCKALHSLFELSVDRVLCRLRMRSSAASRPACGLFAKTIRAKKGFRSHRLRTRKKVSPTQIAGCWLLGCTANCKHLKNLVKNEF